MPPGELAAFAAGAAAQERGAVGSMTRGGSRFTGDAADAYPELAALPGTWGQTPSGASVGRLALAGTRVDVLVTGAPTYIRPSEAEVKYPDGVPGALRKR